MVFKNAFLFFILFVSFTLTAETVRVSTIEGSPVSFVSSQVLTEIYRRARHELIVTPMPASRATVQSTSGITDGETHRILGYGELHPEVLCVPLSYYCTLTVLFVREDNPAINAPLEEIHNYSVAILKGVSNSQRLTEGFMKFRSFKLPIL